jgi:hypothetical protein
MVCDIAKKITNTLISNFYAMIEDTIADLHRRGFTSNFMLLGNRLFCAQTKCFFSGNQFDILEVHSFEEGCLNNEQTLVYAIECVSSAIKGILFENLNSRISREMLSKKLRKFWK